VSTFGGVADAAGEEKAEISGLEWLYGVTLGRGGYVVQITASTFALTIRLSGGTVDAFNL